MNSFHKKWEMDQMKIHAAVSHFSGQEFQIEEIDLAEPKANEVLIKMAASGVCHTDISARDIGFTPFPVVLGHEGSGIVKKTGIAVTTVLPGDHVVLSYAYCGHCKNCLTGRPYACNEFEELNFGGKMDDGTSRLSQNGKSISHFFGQSSFATYAVVNERNVIKVDNEQDIQLVAPLGCGIQTGAGTVLNIFKPDADSSIAVYGVGTVGLSGVMAAKLLGCKMIIAIDIHDNRLELAKELGATHILNAQEGDLVKKVRNITAGGTDFALETSGISNMIKQSVQALRPNGKCANVGAADEYILDEDMLKEGKSIKAVIQGDSISKLFIPKLIEYYKNGHFPFHKLVKYYDFAEINTAVKDSKSGTAIKPVILFNN